MLLQDIQCGQVAGKAISTEILAPYVALCDKHKSALSLPTSQCRVSVVGDWEYGHWNSAATDMYAYD